MKLLLSLILILFSVNFANAQDYRLSRMLFNSYENYKETHIEYRRFNYDHISPIIEELKKDSLFEVQQACTSIEGRPINIIKLGDGEINVLLWSQMHGDESTATMALFDIFKFFRGEDDSFIYTRNRLLRKLSLYFIPMLNPDGAETFTRYNALDIDINRDALRLTSPESRILKDARDRIDPEYGFNLHDQSVYYMAGDTSAPATISFLAPAYDYEQSINDVRRNAMKLIAYLNPMLQEYIPGGVAKYNDAYEPRAFGDNIQKWGTSTILIESGGYPNDFEKQFIRKLNFVTLLSAFDAIAENRFTDFSTDAYFDIPENHSSLSDLIIRNATYIYQGDEYKIDISIRQQQRYLNDTLRYTTSEITAIGDLSTQYAYQEIDATGMKISAGKVYPDTLLNIRQALDLDEKKLLNEGYTGIIVREAPDSTFVEDLPLNIITRSHHENQIKRWATPNLIISEDDKIRYVIVNGFIYDVQKRNAASILNTLVN